MRRLPQLLVRLVAAVLALWAWCGGGARAFAGELPEIKMHPQLEFAVHKGDRIRMEVEAEGDGIQEKWVKGKETICRKLACELETDKWSLGSHQVVFVVLNPKGSLFLKFRIKILATPAGYKPGRVTPPLVVAGRNIEKVTDDDLTVHTVTGRGYSYHKGKVVVVGPVPRALDWGEKLRTQPDSTMQAGKDGSEMHVLAGETSVVLGAAGSGRRAIVLQKGVLRSRVLDGKDPHWSILVGSWMQIDTDAKGDVLVEVLPGGDAATLTVLRGNARVFEKRTGSPAAVPGAEKDKTSVSGRAIAVPAGTSVTIKRDAEEAPALAIPVAKKVGEQVQETTPLYMPGLAIRDQGKGTTLLGADVPKSFAEAKDVVNAASTDSDHMKVIEALQPFLEDTRKNYPMALALGEAYLGIFQEDVGRQFLQQALKLRPKQAKPHFLLGMVELTNRRWKKAAQHFEDADRLAYDDRATLFYYLGVARFFSKETVSAKAELTYSLWEKADGPVADAAGALRHRLKTDGWLDLRLGAGLAYDTNVPRLPAGEEFLPLGIEKRKSAGYFGKAGFSLWPYRGDGGGIALNYDARSDGWLEKSLIKLSTVQQDLSLDVMLAVDATATTPATFTIGIGGLVGVVAVAKQRTHDTVGAHGWVGSPAFFNLKAAMLSRLNLDPLPNRDDIWDARLEEAVPVSERSSREIYYDFGIDPVATEMFTLALMARSGSVSYRSEMRTSENYNEFSGGLLATVHPIMRTDVTIGAGYRGRTFSLSEDKRKDARLKFGAGFRWRYTTALSQVVDIVAESQKSNRPNAAYTRRSGVLGVDFDL